MNARKYLYQHEKMNALIESKQQKILSLKEKAEKITISGFGEKVQSSGKMDKIAEAVADYTDLEREVEEEIRECMALQDEIEKVLACLPSSEYRVLYKRFIEGKELYIVAAEMGKSYSWANKKQRLALKHIQEILDGRERKKSE